MRGIAIIICAVLTAICSAWEMQVPEDIARDYLHADTVIDEKPCDWREPLAAIFRPAVQHCKSAEEAALFIASHMTHLTGAYYSTERRKPNMNALEALAEKKISCTGQSVLLACALRSVGIPARAVIVLTWGHIRGNHTWTEVWLNGEWKMLEFNEKDFNTPWVMEYIGMLDTARPEQRVYALSPRSSLKVDFYRHTPICVEDVTERYMTLAAAWYRSADIPADHQRLLVDIQPRPAAPLPIHLETADGTVLATKPSPDAQNDLRYFTPFNLPRSATPHYLRIGDSRILLHPTSAPAQVLHLRANSPS